jgi:hypothetical protein
MKPVRTGGVDGVAMTTARQQVKARRFSRRSRLPLKLVSGSVVLAHAAGAGRVRVGQLLLATLRRRPATRS